MAGYGAAPGVISDCVPAGSRASLHIATQRGRKY
jgi:hypothetical protein